MRSLGVTASEVTCFGVSSCPQERLLSAAAGIIVDIGLHNLLFFRFLANFLAACCTPILAHSCYWVGVCDRGECPLSVSLAVTPCGHMKVTPPRL